MKFAKCLTDLSLHGKLPEHELKETAAEYQAGGMAPDAAMIRAVEDKLELMQMEEGKITRAVREAYEAQGGKKKPAKAQPKAEPKAVPKPSPKEQFDAIMEQASKDAAAERAKQDAIDIDEPKKGRKADVESIAHGMLFTAQEHKAAAFKRVKALRQQIKDASVGGKSALRLELIKAESRWHEYQQMERDANSKIAEDAAAQGVRYSVQDGVPQAEFGPVHTEYRDDVAGAVDRLMADKTGEAIVHTDQLGDVSLIYGDGKTGLEHIAKRRGADFMERLPGLLQDGALYSKPGQKDRVFIGTDTDEAVLRLQWDGKAKTWLLSAYEKYPDLTPLAQAQQSQRADTVAERAGNSGMTPEGLRNAITKGVLGKIVAAMIDSGIVVLHRRQGSLPKNVRNIEGTQGVFTSDGKIHMVASNVTPDNARAVLLHEAFHEGAEKLLGDEKWGKLMGRLGTLYRQSEQSSGKAREVFDRARVRVAKAQAKALANGKPMATRIQVEEFAAYTIEEYERAPDSLPAAIRKWVEDLIGAVKAWLAKRFDKQLGDITPAQLAAYAKWAVLDHAAARRGEIFGDKGTWFSVNATAEGAPGADVANAEPDSLIPPEQGVLRRVQGALQDNMNRVRQVQDRIEQVLGHALTERSDYYAAETNRPGRIAARLEDIKTERWEPLMQRLAKSGHTQAELESLLHAMHAEERNAAVARINSDMPDGGSGMTNEAAQAIIAQHQGDTELHAIAQQARDIARATLDLKLAYGLITKENYDTYASKYDNYVPLKGDGEFGPKIKRAMGHDEREEHVLDNIARDYDQAVVVGEKNLARQSLLRMVLQNLDPELWTVGVPPKGRYVAGKVYAVMKGNEKVAAFTSQSQVTAFLEGKGNAAGAYRVVDSAGEQVVEFAKPLQDNEVMVYVKGDPVRIQINGDETLARQLRPLKQDQMGVILEKLRGINRYLSKIYTGYNPAFILRNAARDALTGSINMVGHQGALTAAKAWTKYPAAVLALGKWAATGKIPTGEMGGLLTEYRAHGGKVGASYMSDLEQQGKTLQRLFDDAYGSMAYAKDGRPTKAAMVAGRKIVGAMAHVIEVGNQATENGLRLALYAQLREQGATPGVAARAAKTVTVDFDRKGAQTGALGAIYLFFNPAVQGAANSIKTLAQGAHKQQAWAALGGLALLGLYAAGKGMDDDKDRWLGEGWDTRAKNFMINIGGKQLRIPLSQEFAPAYALGVALAEAGRGEKKSTSAVRLLSSFLDAYFPMKVFKEESDNRMLDAAIGLTPTVGLPLFQSAVNRNTFGSEIVPDSELTKDRPDNLKMFRGTKNSAYDKAAQGIASMGEMLGAGKYENDISKVSPETLKLLWRTYTGGLGQFVTDSVGLASMAAADKGQLETGDVPIVKDFIKTPDVKPIRARYYDMSREAKAAITEFQQAKKAGDAAAVEKIVSDPAKAQVLGMSRMVTKVNKAAASIRDAEVDVNQNTKLTPSEKRAELKKLEQQEEDLYRLAIGVFKK